MALYTVVVNTVDSHTGRGHMAGDIVDIRPDGFDWGDNARNSGRWQIFHGIELTEEEVFVARTPGYKLSGGFPLFSMSQTIPDMLNEKMLKAVAKVQYRFNFTTRKIERKNG